MEYQKSYFVEDSENSEFESFHLLGGADRDETYYEEEGDDSYEDDDEGDAETPTKKANIFKCAKRKKDQTSFQTKKRTNACPPWFQRYFRPCASQNTEANKIYGEYYGVNLFGVYSWGFMLTYVNEAIYVGISQIVKGKTQTFSFAKKDPKWEFTDLHYGSSLWFYFIVWISILVLWLIFCVVRVNLLNDTTQKDNFVGNAFPTTLLILTFIPAAFSGNHWESGLRLLKPSNPDVFVPHQGWIVLVIAPLLWPCICSIFVVFIAFCGSSFRYFAPKSKNNSSFTDDEEEEEEEEDSEEEGSDYQS